MSVNPARSGRGWEARWRENGVRRVATFRTKREAEEAERLGKDRARARKHGLVLDAGPLTYAELSDRYLAQHQVSARTLRTLRDRLVYSRAAFGAVRVRELRTEEIARWNAALPIGPTTRGHALRAMRQVCEAGVEWGYLDSNPARAVRLPNVPPKEVRPFESWSELEAVARHAGAYAPLVLFACATGLRPQEWQAIQWHDLDLASRRCRVLRVVRDGKVEAAAKTDGSLRTVVLQARALDALRSMPRPLDGRTLVFPAPEGGVVNLSNFRRRIWQPALDAARLDRRPLYEMRHTFATLALSAGAPIEWIAKQLGHADTRITLRHYARFLPAADDRALALLDAFEDHGGRKVDASANG